MQAFISYNRNDIDFAYHLRDQLRAWGITTWFDRDNIPAGTQPDTKGWEEAIHAGMRTSQAVVGVLSPDSLKSQFVLDEWFWALENKRRLLILWLRDVPSEDIPPHYIRIQRIDCRGEAVAAGLEKLRQTFATDSLIVPVSPPVPSTPIVAPIQPVMVDDNRRALIDNVHAAWISGVLQPTLRESSGLDMGISVSPQQVLRHTDFGDYELPHNNRDILDMFNAADRRLLILGAPGAGKTILLLQLAEKLLDAARHNATHPVPVVLNLSSWVGGRHALDTWIAEEMRHAYGVPRKTGIDLVQRERLLLLLDGLDEVAPSQREACVAAINAFQAYYRGVHLAVCSRSADYADLSTKLDLKTAIVLEPLSPAQQAAYLDGPDFAGLREAMATDTSLQAFTTVPFLISVLAYVYRGMPAAALRLPNDAGPKARQADIFDRYIQKQLQSSAANGYTPAQTRHYLGWLALNMMRHNRSTFYIEELQPTWLFHTNDHLAYRWLVGCAIGALWPSLLCIAPAALVGAAENGGVGGLLGGLFWGFVAVGMGAFIGGLISYSRDSGYKYYYPMDPAVKTAIKPLETFHFDWSPRRLFNWISLGLLAIGIALSLSSWFAAEDYLSLIAAIASGAVFGAGMSITYWFLGGIRRNSVELRRRPNSGIIYGFRNALIIGLGAAVLGALLGITLWLVTQTGTLGGGLYFGLFWLMIGLAVGGIGAVIGHGVLRGLLRRRNFVPRGNYTALLDHAANHQLLRRIGGGYVFRHRYLLEYMAYDWAAKNPAPPAPR